MIIIIPPGTIRILNYELMIRDRLQHVNTERVICVIIITVVFILAAKRTIVYICIISHLGSELWRETQGALIVNVLGIKDIPVICLSHVLLTFVGELTWKYCNRYNLDHRQPLTFVYYCGRPL